MRLAASLIVCLLLAVSLRATTYVVPEDAYLVSAAEAIVEGTVVGTHVRRGDLVTEVAAAEWIKGDGGATVSVVHPRGVVGGPAFAKGDRVLLFLERNRRGEWTTWALALGAFRLDGDVLTRGSVSGWAAGGGKHVERPRRQREFVDYVRAIARGEKAEANYFSERGAAVVRADATVPSASYAWRGANGPFRRSDPRIVWRLTGTPGDLDLAAAVDAGIAAWNGASPNIAFERSPTPASGDRPVDDDEVRVIANDPHGDVPGQCCVGVLAITFWRDHGTHQFGGETYATLTDADVVLNDKMSSANFTQASLNEVVTHELGHALGLRHADRRQNDQGECGGADSNCCVNTHEGGNCSAVMNSQLQFKQPGLMAWDRDAVACLYDGNCLTTCTAPSLLQPPQSRVVYRGLSVAMSATVRGTPPLDIQWYRGIAGDRSTPVATGWLYVVTPEASSQFWVAASGTCGSIESGTANVTIADCPDVTITSASALMVGTEQVRLRVNAAGGGTVRYRWFRRNAPGAQPTLIAIMRELTTRRVEGATYFVEVENPCGNQATSAELTPAATPPPARRRNSRH